VITSIVASMRQRANTRIRAEIYHKLIDKFGSATEIDRIPSERRGLRLIEEQTVEPSQPLARILSSIRLGVSLALIGGGMILVANIWDWTLGQDLWVAIALGGTLALTAGAGFLIAAGISWKLCNMWGLIPTVRRETAGERPLKKLFTSEEPSSLRWKTSSLNRSTSKRPARCGRMRQGSRAMRRRPTIYCRKTYLRFLRAPGRPDDPKEAKQYLYRIATNLVYDRFRSQNATR
jgi:hypothetical protein